MKKHLKLLAVIGPGLLVAATGVGAGDLATASFSGSQLGTAILWAVLLGAFLKYTVTEGLARWQLATGETLLEGAVRRLGPWMGWLFLPYLLCWSFFVGSALMSACGATAHALVPVFPEATDGKIAFGMLHSVAGLVLVLAGGYRLFERVMSVCIGLMVVVVVTTAGLVWQDTAAIIRGLLVPSIPDFSGQGLAWTVALIGGIGGTVTMLCYGYWIREEGRSGVAQLDRCRLDLAVGYSVTAVFGLAMVIIGSTVTITGDGASLLIILADQLAEPVGRWGALVFLTGAWAAVFSSLLGVWQAIPYLFADLWQLMRHPQERRPVDTAGVPYRAYLVLIATVPMLGLFFSFREIQKLYAILGAFFVPALALVLLVMNGRGSWVGERFTNRPRHLFGLIGTLLLFSWIALRSRL